MYAKAAKIYGKNEFSVGEIMKKNIVFLYLLVLLSHLILQKLLSHCDKGLVKMDMLYLWVEDMKRKHFLIDNNVSH